MISARWALALALGTPLAAGPARAGGAEDREPPRAEGYQGVVPGEQDVPPHAPRMPVKGRLQQVTWAGFQPREDGGARVFVQLTGAVEYELREAGDRVVVRLHRARIHVRNNARRIDTRFFEGAVTAVDARARGRGVVEVTVSLRRPAHPTARLEAGKDGYHFLFLDFPASASP